MKVLQPSSFLLSKFRISFEGSKNKVVTEETLYKVLHSTLNESCSPGSDTLFPQISLTLRQIPTTFVCCFSSREGKVLISESGGENIAPEKYPMKHR